MTAPQVPAFTIAANNYLPLARLWAETYRAHHPGAEVRIVLVDRPLPDLDYAALGVPVQFAEELPIPGFLSLAFTYEPIELATAIKPAVFRWLRDALGWKRAAYFDPDIWVLDALPEIDRALAEGASVALTPHITAPLEDGYHPSERSLRLAGIYNLGFVALRLDESTRGFLDWWERRCRRFCRIDPHHGLFVDQSWMDFAPAFLEKVSILRSPRLNLAYWNLAHRALVKHGDRYLVNGEPLGFLHWSGFDPDDPRVLSRHQSRFPRIENPLLAELLGLYRDELARVEFGTFRSIEPAFCRFEPGGIRIPRFLRLLLGRIDPEGENFPDPFDRDDPHGFWHWLREAVAAGGSPVTRAALTLWEGTAGISERFPDPLHADRDAFLAWARSEGAREVELPLELLEPASAPPSPPSFLPYLQQPHRPLLHLVREPRSGLESVDLGQPGPWVSYLLEALPVRSAGGAGLPRLAQVLWLKFDTLAQAFRDPFGVDRNPFLTWLVRYGGSRLGLAAELLAGLERFLTQPAPEEQLPQVGWLGRADRSPKPVPIRERPDRPATPAAVRRTSPVPRKPRILFLGASRREPQAWLLAEASARLLEQETGWSTSCLDLDRDFLAHSTDGFFLPPGGGVPDFVVFHGELSFAPWRLGWLPTSTFPARKIALFDWEVTGLPPWASDRLAHWDSIWAPSAFARDTFASQGRIPVDWVPPCLLQELEGPTGRAGQAREVPLGTQVLRIQGWAHLHDPLERDDPWAFLEIVRAVRERLPGLDLELELRLLDTETEPNPATEAAARLAALRDAGGDLPLSIRYRSEPATFPDLALVTSRSGRVQAEVVRAAARGAVVAGPAWGFLADFLSDRTGWVLPHREVPIPASVFGSPARRHRWIELAAPEAADRLAERLSSPPASWQPLRQRMGATLRELYGPGAVVRRMVERLTESGSA